MDDNAKEKRISGIKKWTLEYKQKIPNINKLKRQVQEFMDEFDRNQEAEKVAEKIKKTTTDNDGWITVTRTGKKKGIPRKAAIEERILEKEKEKMKKQETQSFYKFQIRESKMRNLEELRKKFEEDKKRISVIRASRKFKPY